MNSRLPDDQNGVITLRWYSLLSLLIALAFVGGAGADEVESDIAMAAQQIDQLLRESWDGDGITAAANSGDAEFCRRVWLDLGGVAPPPAEIRQFLDSTSEDKRERLVDRLLRSPQHANHMATRWQHVLLPADTQTMPQDNAAALQQWLRQQFIENVPYDHLVGGFLTAGGASDSGPAIFYTSHSLQAEKLAAATSKIFMGIQLQCAQCHNHPFDRWSQEDFWHYAAFFAQLTQSDDRTGRDQIIIDRPGGEVRLPDTDRIMPPMYPGVIEPPERDPTDNRRRQLTIWMASRDNPYFARAAVNRVWAHLFGRGLVEPVDAMDAGNKPSHPELLEYLADFFTSHRFNLRTLYATLARTNAYGRTSAVADQRPPEDSFAAMSIKTLTAEQYYDSLVQNVFRLSRGSDNNADRFRREQFISRMRATATTPRDYPHGVVQALGMMNGPEIEAAAGYQSGLLQAINAPIFDDRDRIEMLFLATVSRFPTDKQAQRFSKYISEFSSTSEQRRAQSDLLWSLLNTAECAVCP